MSSTYQSLIVLLISSMVVITMWYADREVKALHANIKIIQNMLKVVISNQNQTPVITQPFQPEHYPVHEQIIIPESRVGTLDAIQEETKSDDYIPFADEIDENEIILTNEQSVKDLDSTPIETEPDKVDVKQEPVNEQIIEPKKKRTYKKKNTEITV